MSKRGKYLLTILGTLPLLILIAWGPWSSLLYHGDGKFSDELLFYPRYWVRFADIPLNEASEHHFHFRGMPHEEMSLVLYIKDRQVDTWADRAPLVNLPVTIEAILQDDKGGVTCHAMGRPAPANRDGIWVLVSGGVTGYWHYQCNFVQIYHKKNYDLTIRVSDVGPVTEKVVVTPTLEGGGLELP
jgi:hypothetical protein